MNRSTNLKRQLCLTQRLIYDNLSEGAGLTEAGSSNPNLSFDKEKQRVLIFLDKVEASDPTAKTHTLAARKKVEELSSSKEKAKKASDVEINKLIIELQNTLKPFENLYIAAELQKSKGLERTNLKKIIEDKYRQGKIFPKGYNYFFNNCLFVSADLKSFTLLNAVSNDIKVTDTKVHSISDINGKTRNYIQVSIGGGPSGYMEEDFFDYSLLPLAPKISIDTKVPKSENKEKLDARIALLAKVKVAPPIAHGSPVEDLAFEDLLLTGSESDYQAFKKYKVDQLTTAFDELYVKKKGQIVEHDIVEIAFSDDYNFAEYKVDKDSPWAKNFEELKDTLNQKAVEWLDQNGLKKTSGNKMTRYF